MSTRRLPPLPRSVVVLLLLALLPRMARPLAAEAATLTFQVTSTVDAPDATPGDGVCATATHQCSLRAAIEEADAQPAGSVLTITIPAGTYPLTLGPLLVTSNTVTLVGAGLNSTTIDGQGARVLAVANAAFAGIGGVTLRGGNAGIGAGGGISNLGVTVLSQSMVIDNTATNGGGLYNAPGARLLLLSSSVMSDTAPAGAGGGIANAGIMEVYGSSLSENTALVGGAITSTGTLLVAGSTVTTNTATLPCCTTLGGGGAMYTSGTTIISGSLLSGNASTSDGGGIFNDRAGTTALIASIIVGNSTSPARSILDSESGGGLYNAGTLTLATSIFSGNASVFGGGLYNAGTLTLAASTFTRNTTLSGNPAFANDGGGGIENSGTLTLTASTFSGNMASNGGGLYNAGTLTLANSTFSGNTAVWGGGIETIAKMTSTNSTVSGNMATHGGGIENGGTVTLTSNTLSGNAATNGGGIDNLGTATLPGTIVANSANGPNCSGMIGENQGYNLDSGTSCGLSKTTDSTNRNPLLGPLAANGGPTPTLALLPGSPAIDHGGTSATGCPATDQRGVARPDEAGDGGVCDIGAYES